MPVDPVIRLRLGLALCDAGSGGDAVLHMDLETILSNLGFREFHLDGRLDLQIAAASAGGGWSSGG